MISVQSFKKIRLAIILSSILKEPFHCLYPILPFLMLRDLNASALSLTIYAMLKPVASFFSFYFSELISHQRMTLKSAMLWTGLLARLSFIPALIFEDIALFIFGSTMYMIFSRAEMPAWMEVIKKNVFREKWEKTFSNGSILSYVVGVFFTLFYVSQFKSSWIIWKSAFAISLVLEMCAVFIQALLIDNDHEVVVLSKETKKSVIEPVKGVFKLLKEEPEFARFQWSFMLGGLGLMIIQPVIPLYFTDVLAFDTSNLLIAFSVCKALGFVSTTPLWNRLIKKLSSGAFISLVLVGFALYSAFLIAASITPQALFLAYLIFGISQAGSHLVWHLSGPMFSKEQSSPRYSAVNVVMVGLRGLIGPALGYLLLFVVSPIAVFVFSVFLCLSGNLFYLLKSKVIKTV